MESSLPDALAAVGPMLGADRLHVWLEGEDGELREVASWHAPGVEPWAPEPASTAGQWIRVIRNVVARDRSPIVVNDTNGVIAREEPTADAYGSLGVRAVILCPLARVANGIRGVLSVQDAGGPREWSPYELTLVDAIANEIGTAFGHAKAYALERESVERLEALDAEKSAFVSTVSHELRTPLTSIIGYLEMLRDGDGGPINRDQGVMLEVIERNSERLLGLVDDLLVVSRLQSGKHRFDVTAVPVATLVAQAVDALGPSARLQHVAIVSNAGDDVGSVLGDPAQLERVTLNLVSNAVKFTPAGGRVDVDVQRDGDVVRLVVSDNGIGIPADEHHRLFTRFFRSSSAQRESRSRHRARAVDREERGGRARRHGLGGVASGAGNHGDRRASDGSHGPYGSYGSHGTDGSYGTTERRIGDREAEDVKWPSCSSSRTTSTSAIS